MPVQRDKKMSKIITSLQDSWNEFAVKATWPSLSELQKSTVLVIIGTIIFSLVVFGMDKAISTVLEFVFLTANSAENVPFHSSI